METNKGLITTAQPGTMQLAVAGGVKTFELIPNTPAEIKTILHAANAPKLETLTDQELEEKILLQITGGLALLGHKNHLSDANDLVVLTRAVANFVRLKYQYRTVAELEIIFTKGICGELKTRPDEVVFLNIEQISNWFRLYREKVKPQAMEYLREPKEPETATGISFAEWRERNPESAKEWDKSVERLATKSRAQKAEQAEQHPPRKPFNETEYQDRIARSLPNMPLPKLRAFLKELESAPPYLDADKVEQPNQAAAPIILLVKAEIEKRKALKK